jgi:CBS domain-containing protein
MQVGSLIGDEVVFIAPDASLREVAESLTANEIGLVAVGLNKRPVAVVSERDVTRAVAQSRDPEHATATDIAQRELVWCDASASVAEVAAEMMDRYVRHVLVESGGKLVGIVSARDLLGYYAASDEEELTD